MRVIQRVNAYAAAVRFVAYAAAQRVIARTAAERFIACAAAAIHFVRLKRFILLHACVVLMS